MFGFLVLILPATRVIGNFHWPLFREPGKLLNSRLRVSSRVYTSPSTLTPCGQRSWIWWFREPRDPHQLLKQPLQPFRERIVLSKNPCMHR